ncbi:YopX family protein [Lactiplantibacillus plantarum]|uniref:YopX family protein n=1 Tax=Lactiplantibacillus plantarum TaxID=1590 RepID=UPI0007B292EA|nr:YopX family protein [Lactiplantibacillus plantarum]KZD99570.1 prophage Lp1 protein 30 [Lactiplantibacillus plantarum]
MIKFRAWDKIQNKMLLPDNIEFIHGQSYWAEASTDSNGSYSNDGKVDGIDALFKLEQFTGLKDVNGKDIYEGDAVQPVSSYINLKRGKPFEVKKDNYVYGKWIAKDISSKEFSVDGCYFSDEIQLIGNVHANPELLKG